MEKHNKFEFFPKQRRRIELLEWHPLCNEQGEKRLRLDFLMPLTGQALVGIPNFVGPSYENMERENSAAGDSDLLVELEGVTLEAFSTETNEFPIQIDTLGLNLPDPDKQLGTSRVLMTAATMRKFCLVRETREKLALVCLRFSVTFKAEAGLVLWAFKYHRATFWVLFTETQPTVPDRKQKEEPTAQLPLTADQETVERVTRRLHNEAKKRECPFSDGENVCAGELEHDGDHELVGTAVLAGARSANRKRQKPPASGAGAPN